MSTSSGQQPLSEVIEQQIASVDARVNNGGGVYNAEMAEVRLAAERIGEVQRSLGLGEFVTSLTPQTGKPQFLLVFERGNVSGGADQKVLKVYGRVSPGEGLIQKHLTDAGHPVVPTIDFGDEPTSWLLMEPVPGRDLADELREHPDRVASRTRQLAGIMERFSGNAPSTYDGVQSLESGILRHLDAVVAPLVNHGYEVPAGWREHAIATYNSGPGKSLHNDLFPGNIRVTNDPEVVRQLGTDLVVLDSAADSCVGAPEFDAARWIARVGTPETFDELAQAWMEGAPSTNEGRLRGMLATETLMQAGVIEIIKDEQGLPSAERDSATLALLSYYNAQLTLQAETGIEGPRL